MALLIAEITDGHPDDAAIVLCRIWELEELDTVAPTTMKGYEASSRHTSRASRLSPLLLDEFGRLEYPVPVCLRRGQRRRVAVSGAAEQADCRHTRRLGRST